MELVGQAALIRMLGLRVPPPAVESYIAESTRPQSTKRTETDGNRVREYYPRSRNPGDSVISQLRFALKHEPLDLGVLVAAFRAMDETELVEWVRSEPTGDYSRRAWFLYETFTGRTLDLPPAKLGNYVRALDPARQFDADGRRSRRHRVLDNLLGGRGFCPTVRRTVGLNAAIGRNLAAEARALAQHYDRSTLARAVSFLYTKETRSSFHIEGETLSASRTQRFVATLQSAAGFDPTSKAEIVRLQGEIVDPRFAESDWRLTQNFVGEIISGYRDRIHFITPKPEDLPDLMAGWMEMAARLLTGSLDPVITAALVAFGFVFIHPFNDGNGRIHRFLVHCALARQGFGDREMVFPISASILRNRRAYDSALESFSKPLFDLLDWHVTQDHEIAVTNETADLYRYFDATALAEYLFDRVADAIRHDLREELDFVTVYDRALAGIAEIVDLPDREASLFVRLCLQNRGHLAAGKRDQFPKLSDSEIAQMETAVRLATDSVPAESPSARSPGEISPDEESIDS